MGWKNYPHLLKGVIIGGIIGLLVHFIQHLNKGIKLLVIAPHIINGVIYTSAGIILGVLIAVIIKRTNNVGSN